MKVGNVEYHAFKTRNDQWRCRVSYAEIRPEGYQYKEFTTDPFAKRWMALEAAEGHLQTQGVAG